MEMGITVRVVGVFAGIGAPETTTTPGVGQILF